MAENPFDKWPIRPVPQQATGDLPAIKPVPTEKADEPKTIPEAVKESAPTWKEIGDYAGNLYTYALNRLNRGAVGGPPDTPQGPFGIGYHDPGTRQDFATGAAGSFAEDFGRNPLFTMAMPIITALGATGAEAMTTPDGRMTGPEWEKLLFGSALSLLKPRDIFSTRGLVHGGGVGWLADQFFPEYGKYIGLASLGLSRLGDVGRRIAREPLRALARTAVGAHQADVQGGPILNALTSPPTGLSINTPPREPYPDPYAGYAPGL